MLGAELETCLASDDIFYPQHVTGVEFIDRSRFLETGHISICRTLCEVRDRIIAANSVLLMVNCERLEAFCYEPGVEE